MPFLPRSRRLSERAENRDRRVSTRCRHSDRHRAALSSADAAAGVCLSLLYVIILAEKPANSLGSSAFSCERGTSGMSDTVSTPNKTVTCRRSPEGASCPVPFPPWGCSPRKRILSGAAGRQGRISGRQTEERRQRPSNAILEPIAVVGQTGTRAGVETLRRRSSHRSRVASEVRRSRPHTSEVGKSRPCFPYASQSRFW